MSESEQTDIKTGVNSFPPKRSARTVVTTGVFIDDSLYYSGLMAAGFFGVDHG